MRAQPLLLAIALAALLAGCTSAGDVPHDGTVVWNSDSMRPTWPAPAKLLYVDVAHPDDVTVALENGPERFGRVGDVLVYAAGGDDRKLIAHRALTYVEVREDTEGVTYAVRVDPSAPCEGNAVRDAEDPRWCVFGEDGVHLPSSGIARPGSTPEDPQPYRPEHSGFLTQGDNPETNPWPDQIAGLSPPVRLKWVLGSVVHVVPLKE